MTMLAAIIGITALVPAMAGPSTVQDGGPAELHIDLCRGGTIAIPLGQGDGPAMPGTVCCAKGCQRRNKQASVDPEQ